MEILFSGFDTYSSHQESSQSRSRSTKLLTSLEVIFFIVVVDLISMCILLFAGDLDDDIEFDDVDSEGSGSDEGDDIDGI